MTTNVRAPKDLRCGIKKGMVGVVLATRHSAANNIPQALIKWKGRSGLVSVDQKDLEFI